MVKCTTEVARLHSFSTQSCIQDQPSPKVALARMNLPFLPLGVSLWNLAHLFIMLVHLILFTSFFLYFPPPSLASLYCYTSVLQLNNEGWMLAAWLYGLRGYLPNVSLASQSLARMLRLLQSVGPQPSDGRPLASRRSHVAGCHRHFVHQLTTLASVTSRAHTSFPSQHAKEPIFLTVVYTGCQWITCEQGY